MLSRVERRGISVLCLVVLVLLLFPFLWFFLLSLKTERDAFTAPFSLFKPTLDHYISLLTTTDFPRYLGNSVTVGLGSTLFALVLGVPVAYALSRGRFGYKRPLLAAILLVRMAPAMMFVVPFFIIYRTFGLLDTQVGLMLMHAVFSIALVVWTMQTFFAGVPAALDEAARVDGASLLQCFIRVILPLTAPGLLATAVLCFLHSWNEFLFALILTRSEARTAPLAVVNFMAFEGAQWGHVAAGVTLLVIPVFAFAVLTRRFLVQGLLGGAVKG